MLPTSWSIFKIVPLGVRIETGTCWIHRFSIMLSENAISLQMKLPNILECRIDLSKPTAFGVTNSCVLKGPQYWTSSCQKLLAGFQEKLLNFQEGKLQLRKNRAINLTDSEMQTNSSVLWYAWKLLLVEKFLKGQVQRFDRENWQPMC